MIEISETAENLTCFVKIGKIVFGVSNSISEIQAFGIPFSQSFGRISGRLDGPWERRLLACANISRTQTQASDVFGLVSCLLMLFLSRCPVGTRY